MSIVFQAGFSKLSIEFNRLLPRLGAKAGVMIWAISPKILDSAL